MIGFRDGVDGAEERLQAARVLQDKLELILRGEPPYDVFVRWKPLHEQPMGWEPERRRLSLLCVLCVSVVKTAREAARCKERT